MTASRVRTILLIALSLLFYFFIAQTPRHETVRLLTLFLSLFAIYTYIIRSNSEDEKIWLVAAIAFRLLFLFFIPLLSDDAYRFIWDGRLMAADINPFSTTPSALIRSGVSIPGITPELFQQLNSPDYFTVYPPVSQFIFLLAAKFTHSVGSSIALMQILLITAEAATLVLMRKLLKHYLLPTRHVLIYALNPLVILEVSGNLHFEALMIFFILLAVWWIVKGKMVGASIAMAMAIATKLLPLILLPLFFYRLGWKKAFSFVGYTGTVCILLFAPLYSEELVRGISNGLGYYFQKFEFNASIYYLVREYGFWKYGYNIIQTVGWKLGLWCTMFIGVYSFLESQFRDEENRAQGKSIWISFIIVFTLYFLFTTTLHPWYITSLIAFSIFTNSRYAILWSATIFLTYVGYSQQGFSESKIILVLEYGTLLIAIGYELFQFLPSHDLAKDRDFGMKQ